MFFLNKCNELKYKKLPKFLLIIDNYFTITEKQLEKIKNKIETIKLLMISKENTKNLHNIASKYKLENTKNAIQDAGNIYPDLIILLNDVFEFNLECPLLLYKAEICHYRRKFDEGILESSLKHYSECEIRDGR
ncbi:hypothetical protein TCON_0545 [Astathelohania contejeani]|uniref:Uncharacterized protein n=1 Tax=Astathelohania contejeani TaxID=164912 RepID=A0ABQ7I1A4_9MICR|nr:hypothetical protein TCON_0545 [Thelohania contejeani]